MNQYVDELTTSRLENILKDAKNEKDIERYIETYTNRENNSFAEYFNSYVVSNNLDYPSIMCRSNVSKNYFYNIVNGDRNPGRDKIIALCVAAGMCLDEVNRCLKIAKEGVLYAKDRRDATIIFEINRGTNSIVDLNIKLEEQDLDIIK